MDIPQMTYSINKILTLDIVAPPFRAGTKMIYDVALAEIGHRLISFMFKQPKIQKSLFQRLIEPFKKLPLPGYTILRMQNPMILIWQVQ